MMPGRRRRFSDVDLTVDAGQPLETQILIALADELEESDLPFKVDVPDWRTLDERFRSVIEGQRIGLELGADPGALVA